MTQYRFLLPQNSFDLKADYGNSDFDTRHNFTTLISYDLPGRSKGPRWLLQGWQVSSLLSFHTGQPLFITTANDNTGTNELVQRPNLVGNPFAGVSHEFSKSGVQWINPGAFALPAPGTFGNLSRNKFYGPGFGSVDYSVFKNTKLGERVTAQLRFEFYNLFNRVNLAPPKTSPIISGIGFDGPNAGNGFGQSVDTIGDFMGAPGIGPGEPFNVQFALKIIF